MQALWYWDSRSNDRDRDYRVGNIYSVDTLDKAVVHILGKMEWDCVRFHHATHKGTQFKK